MNYETVEKKLVQALLSFTYDSRPFWTLVGMRMKRVPVDGCRCIKTLVTDKAIELHYDPELVEQAELSKLRFHFVHEILHLIYRHMFRFTYSKDYVDLGYLANNPPKEYKPINPVKASDIASDLAANRDMVCMFPDYGQYGLVAKDVPNFQMPDFNNASSEDIEKYICDTYLKVTQGNGQGGGAGQKDGQGGGNGNGDGGTDVNGKHVDNHNPAASETESDLIKRVKQRMVEGAVSDAVNRGGLDKGNVPASLQQEIELLMKPPRKDWRALLSAFVKASIPKDSNRTWGRINRRIPYIIKGKRSKRVPLIGVAVDTSGSVSDEALKAFLEEINHIRKVHGSDLDIVQCDCEISNVVHVKAKQKIPTKVFGGGGTEFIPALEWFDKAQRKPDVVVFFTDLLVGDSDVPKEPRSYELLWVSVTEAQCEHFQELGAYGKFIYMNPDEEDL